MALGGAPNGRGLAEAATALEAVFAILLSLGALAFLAIAPTLGGLELGGGDSGDSGVPFTVHGLGFSPIDAVATALVVLSLSLWVWTALDLVYVVRPLGRHDPLGAEGPALLLGIVQLVFGGVLPGLLMLLASRQARAAIRADPALEARRSVTARAPTPPPRSAGRILGRAAMFGFGILWGIAGVSMFQNQFYLHLPELIRTASQGSPAFLDGWFHFWTFLTSLGAQPAVYLAGAVQLLLAFALIAGFARKIAYFGGLFVSVFLWIVPEAFGGPFVLGAFSLGPGIVYAIGLLALIALNANYGRDLASVDALIERRWPRWERVAEVSVGLVPQIGGWYRRNAAVLARSCEVAMGAVFATSATLAWATHLGNSLGSALAARSATSPGLLGAWNSLWAAVAQGNGPALGAGIVVVEYAIAVSLILGLARKATHLVGLSLVLFVWMVLEGFGGAPGPGYTDPGVGIAEACVFLALLGIVAVHASEGSGVDPWVSARHPAWRRIAEISTS